MPRATLRICAVFSLLFISACATAPSDRETATYHDSAMNDRNRAPASMVPPSSAGDIQKSLNPLSLRTQADYNFAMGEAFSFDGLHSKAIESFKTVLIYDPESVPVHLRLAAEYVKIGSMAEALKLAEQAEKLDPSKVDSHLLLGGLYSSLKNYPKAIRQYETALKIDKENSDALMYLAAVYAEIKEYDKAVKYFEALANLDEYATPQLAYFYIGRIREDQGTKASVKAAEASYKKALSLKADYVEAVMALTSYYTKREKTTLALDLLKKFQRDHGPSMRIADLLSALYLQEEKYPEALEQLEILESDPEETLNVKMKMALIYIDQKNYPNAANKLTEVLRVAPDSDKVRFYLAAVYEEMGQGLKAAEHFQKIPPTSSYFQDSIVHAAYLLKEQKKTPEAVKIVKEALKERKDIPQLYAVYASLMDDQGDLNNAISLLEEGITKFPEYVQLRFFMGTLQDRKGNKEKSVEHMKKVVEMDPNHVQGLNYLAFTYADMGKNLEEAEKLVKRALEMEPKDGYILDTYGWVLFKQNRLNEAVRVLETAYTHQPEESIIAEHLGDAYYRSQLLEKARRMYEKAAENMRGDENRLNEVRSKISAIEKQEMVGLSPRQPASVGTPASKNPKSDR